MSKPTIESNPTPQIHPHQRWDRSAASDGGGAGALGGGCGSMVISLGFQSSGHAIIGGCPSQIRLDGSIRFLPAMMA